MPLTQQALMQGAGLNSYGEQQMQEQYGGSPMADLALLGGALGADIGMSWTTNKLLGAKRLEEIRQAHGRIGGFFLARKEAFAQSRPISEAAWGTKGGPWAKWKGAKAAARKQIGDVTTKYGTKTGTAILGRMTAGSGMRAAAGLLRAPLGVANAYMWLGSMVPMIAEGAIAGMSAAMREGARIRNSTPETSVGWQDMATRERAFTMRQASSMAIHMSQSGARAALGNEADFLH